MKQLHFSLIHGTIHHHQHSSFLTNMTVGHSFSTKIEMVRVQSFYSWCHPSSVATLETRIKCVDSDLDVISKQVFDSLLWVSLSPKRNHSSHQRSSFLTNMTVGQSFSTKLEIFEVQSFSSWCHHQGQPWRRGSSASFLILMSYQSSPLIVFNETSLISLSHSRNYPSSSTQQFSD